ncbi:MAG: response regulator [Alphaproteobacteria bacterium]
MANAQAQIDVLVVDDDPSQLEEITDYLIRKGLTVMTADNGLTALDMVREHSPQLVVMDINMPQMQGDRISQVLTSLDHKTAVILMSGFPDVYDRVSATAEGVIAVMQKPISLKALHQTVEAVIDA